MTIATYLINLDGSTERLAAATAQLQQYGIAFERITAVDGRKIPPEQLQNSYQQGKAITYMGRDLSPGEIGCYLSHIKAVRAFVASTADVGVVLEDDFCLQINYMPALQTAVEWLQSHGRADWQAINISNAKLKIASRLCALPSNAASGRGLYHAHYFPMLATAVVWSRAGAEAFLKIAEPIFCPYDNVLRYWQTRENKGYSIFPPLICSSEVISDIDAAGKRKTIRRGKGYGWAKQKRLWQDKFIAMRNKINK